MKAVTGAGRPTCATRFTPGLLAAFVMSALMVAAGFAPVAAKDPIVPGFKAVTSFVNAASQTILDGAQVTPVSTIEIPQSVKGYVVDVDVKLRALNHESPDDLAIMLVGPRGQAVVVMGDAGNTDTIINTYLTFDDEAASQLPNPGQIISGTYKPSNFIPPPSNVFTSGAPVPNSATLAGFDGTDPRGTWLLYVLDDTINSADGVLALGWELILTTTNTKPHARNEKYRTNEDQKLDVKRKDGLLKNATDADGNNTIKVQSRGKQRNDKGSIKIYRDGSFYFRPKRHFTGKATYPYTIVDDKGKTDSAKVIINVEKKK